MHKHWEGGQYSWHIVPGKINRIFRLFPFLVHHIVPSERREMIGEETGESSDYSLGESLIARDSSFHIDGEAGRIIKLSNNGGEKSAAPCKE